MKKVHLKIHISLIMFTLLNKRILWYILCQANYSKNFNKISKEISNLIHI